MARGEIELHVEQHGLKRLAAALSIEADGKKLRADLIKNLREAVKPAVTKTKGEILSMHSSGLSHGEPLRAAIARQIKPEVRVSGKLVGVRVRAKNRGMPRGFGQAPKRTNASGWRHPVYGKAHGGIWVHQIGKPGWFERPLEEGRREYRVAVKRAMDEAARRITQGV